MSTCKFPYPELTLFTGLHGTNRSHWRIGGGFTLLGFAWVLITYTASIGTLAVGFALLLAVANSGVALVAAIGLAWGLKNKRKTVALFVGIIFPISLFIGTQVGDSYSPEGLTQQNGDYIIRALDEYHAASRKYPTQLVELIPQYFPSLPEAFTTQRTGWLYNASANEFALGYWYYPEKMGSEVCLYTSKNLKWECGFNNWGLFSMVPTPTPNY